MTWLLVVLADYPVVQKKMLQEIVAALEIDTDLTVSDFLLHMTTEDVQLKYYLFALFK